MEKQILKTGSAASGKKIAMISENGITRVCYLDQATIECKIQTLTSSIDTVGDQITRLANHYPALQVKIWRKHKAKLNKELKAYKQMLKDVSARTNQLTLTNKNYERNQEIRYGHA